MHASLEPHIYSVPIITEANVGSTTATTFAEVVDDQSEVNPEQLSPRLVVENPEKYLPMVLEYWKKHLPDISEGRPNKAEELQFWKTICASLTAHKTMPGLNKFALQNTNLLFETHICFYYKHKFVF